MVLVVVTVVVIPGALPLNWWFSVWKPFPVEQLIRLLVDVNDLMVFMPSLVETLVSSLVLSCVNDDDGISRCCSGRWACIVVLECVDCFSLMSCCASCTVVPSCLLILVLEILGYAVRRIDLGVVVLAAIMRLR